jgi:hypothetical protein
MGAGASSGVAKNAITNSLEDSIREAESPQEGNSSNNPTPLRISLSPSRSVNGKIVALPVSPMVGKSAFRALLSLDEAELVLANSPGSKLRKLAGAEESHLAKKVLLRNLKKKNATVVDDTMPTKKKGPVKLTRKMNTTSTLLSLNTTMENASSDITISSIAHVIRTHIANAFEQTGNHPIMSRKWEVFNDSYILLDSPRNRGDEGISIFHDTIRNSPVPTQRTMQPSFDNISGDSIELPQPSSIVKFITHLFKSAQMEIDSLIIALIYLERLLETGIESGLILLKHNWKTLTFTCLLLGSKIWDDLAMENKDLASLWPPITLKRVNQLERRALEALKYNVKVPASLYAQYYFRLRTLVTYLDLGEDEVSNAFKAMQPLTSAEARKMEILSSRYEDRVVDVIFSKPKGLQQRSMSFDSGMQNKNPTAPGSGHVPASLEEFMSTETEGKPYDMFETALRGESVWKRRDSTGSPKEVP